jgi:hypothetical protein
MKPRTLVVFVDAFGAAQLDHVGTSLSSLPHRRALEGVLGYSSGALATVLTGAPPRDHGRMCLFSAASIPEESILRPLRFLGLLPRFVHERPRVRRVVAEAFARASSLTGYVALQRVPPEAFEWLDLPEREDLFEARDIGGVPTFLAEARDAGLSVYAAPWQLPEDLRWEQALQAIRMKQPDLAFLYATVLDARLHRHGNRGEVVEQTLAELDVQIERAREAMAVGDVELTTLVVGDHGMADVEMEVDPRPLLQAVGAKVFVDSTMLRIWGRPSEVQSARRISEQAGWPGTWLDEAALDQRGAHGSSCGDAFFLLREGAMFAPSYMGMSQRGMHGYDVGATSARAALVSDRPIPEGVTALTHLAGLVRARINQQSGVARRIREACA